MLSIASEGLGHNGLWSSRPGPAARVKIAHYEPIAQQAGHQNQRREHERGGIGPRPADQESCHERREDAGDVSDKVFHARPHADLIRRSASLQDGQDVAGRKSDRSEEHTSELQSLAYLVCRLLLEKKKKKQHVSYHEDK